MIYTHNGKSYLLDLLLSQALEENGAKAVLNTFLSSNGEKFYMKISDQRGEEFYDDLGILLERTDALEKMDIKE
ncbi:hypothetical protein HCX49_21880 [Sphingobacterium kitahiroshimense]|uniref:hypothetical protein n=1 Tax=Sphingobacterium sp. B16(2022) TaxID=2914044 RepID=UPI00143C0C95|nr:hypothetical protein [Sphingobacterium sp. B16(2022)]NJI75851.1 hypothetical protein [Sphingobacterium sp. B16(2022)]